ncbi:MAG: NADH-quinone oxidoreductase subunit B, partial [Candidatus Hydrogenedentes bacterium]|nr:NADH-quinone oxidoreductase subunit B [Candidatus Hydrogenedentota bacterium]
MGLITEKMPAVLEQLPGGAILVTSLDYIFNSARANSLWPLMFGTKCCA